MSEHDPRAGRAVELAVAAAGVHDGGWRRRMFEALADISSLLRDGSPAIEWADKIVQAHSFKATYRGYEEEIPQGYTYPTRLIIETQSDNAIVDKPGKPEHNPEGIEYTRTEPLWTPAGKLMRARLDDLPVDSVITVYKVTEVMSEKQKVRVMVHFDIVRRGSGAARTADTRLPASPPPDDQESSSDATAPDEAPARAPQPAPEPGSPGDNAALSEIERRFDALDARKRIAYKRLCEGHDITNVLAPEPEQLAAALDFMTEVEG